MPKADTRDGSQYCDVLWLNGNYIQQEDFILEIIQLYYKIFTYNMYIQTRMKQPPQTLS